MNCIQPERAGGGDVEVAAVVGLDLVDRGEDLPAHAVLDAGGLVDREQERRDPELVDEEVRHADRGGAGGDEREGRVVERRRAVEVAAAGCGLGASRALRPRALPHLALERLGVGAAGRVWRPCARRGWRRRSGRRRRRPRPAGRRRAVAARSARRACRVPGAGGAGRAGRAGHGGRAGTRRAPASAAARASGPASAPAIGPRSSIDLRRRGQRRGAARRSPWPPAARRP